MRVSSVLILKMKADWLKIKHNTGHYAENVPARGSRLTLFGVKECQIVNIDKFYDDFARTLYAWNAK